ncbi:hypothetical protein [Methanimicrococcus hongohii]|uniref:hypothetical protein n=1 Tax=Methanimicrococcus hongohii TaxID=3028295 RepID=UPI0029316946|nr:hypothetical protein [Methanimicrococcus sp. Hf6]
MYLLILIVIRSHSRTCRCYLQVSVCSWRVVFVAATGQVSVCSGRAVFVSACRSGSHCRQRLPPPARAAPFFKQKSQKQNQLKK